MSPKMMKRKKNKVIDEQDDITKKISKMIKQNEDNNNVILKQVNESLSRVEDKSDEKLGLKEEITIEEEKQYKTFRDKYNDLKKHKEYIFKYLEVRLNNPSDNVTPIASLGDTPPKVKVVKIVEV